MNDYEDQLLGGTLPELTPEQKAELAQEQEAIDANLEQLQPEVGQPEVSQAAATAAPAEAPPQQTEEPQILGQPESFYTDPTSKQAAVAGVPSVRRIPCAMSEICPAKEVPTYACARM